VGEAWVTSRARRRNEIVIASATMPLALPILAGGLALSRMLDGPKPLFRQERVGKDNEKLEIIKIRTMDENAAHGPSLGSHDDRRTPLGKILSATTADETPQFWSVLTGKLKLFGPRAIVQDEMDHMGAILPRVIFDEWQHAYFTNGPGLISTYNLASHGRARNLEQSYWIRAVSDSADFRKASYVEDMMMLASIGITAGRVATQMITQRQPEPLSVQYLE